MADLLVVEDDPDIAALLAEALQSIGHEVRVAYDGLEGLRLVAERRPDVLLLDVEMPVLTGPDMACAMLLRNCGDEQIPIVLQSGVVGLSWVAAHVGTPYFLAKPYTMDAVCALLARALRERIPPKPGKPEKEDEAHDRP